MSRARRRNRRRFLVGHWARAEDELDEAEHNLHEHEANIHPMQLEIEESKTVVAELEAKIRNFGQSWRVERN